MQTVASEGPEVMRLVERAAWRVPPRWLDRVRRVATMEVGRGRVEAAHGLVDQLTDREREVLRFLPSRLTLREIAAELAISMNTLKFHLKMIYRKLQCGSRAEAAAIARGLTAGRPTRSGPEHLAALTLELVGAEQPLGGERAQLAQLGGGVDEQTQPGVGRRPARRFANQEVDALVTGPRPAFHPAPPPRETR